MSDDLYSHAIGARGRTAARGDSTAARRFAVSAERLLQDWKAAHSRAVAYLEALGVPEGERDALAGRAVERAVEDTGEAVAATLRAVRELLAGGGGDEFRTWHLRQRPCVKAGDHAAANDSESEGAGHGVCHSF